jgi:hypothetical protein
MSEHGIEFYSSVGMTASEVAEDVSRRISYESAAVMDGRTWADRLLEAWLVTVLSVSIIGLVGSVVAATLA